MAADPDLVGNVRRGYEREAREQDELIKKAQESTTRLIAEGLLIAGQRPCRSPNSGSCKRP